jgi:DNA-binding NarL/FixJ family response regulator
MQNKGSVLIAEDHLLFSEGLKMFLQNHHVFSEIFQARNGLEAIALAKSEKPNIVLMDIQMPEMDGLQAAFQIKQAVPESRIIMLTSFTDTESVKRALSAGVEGYCSKDIDPNRLISVIDMVNSGSIYLDPAVADFVLKHYFLNRPELRKSSGKASGKKPPIVPVSKLSQSVVESLNDGEGSPKPSASFTHEEEDPEEDYVSHPGEPVEPVTGQVLKGRELEILALIANNMNHEEIAESLHISVDWVSSYIKNILQKLAVDDEWTAVKKAIGDGAIRKAVSSPEAE